MANFNRFIDKIDLDSLRELCLMQGKLRHYKKGEFFLRSGESPKYFGFIESGYFNYFVVDSLGNERITGFALCNTLAGDFYSSLHNVPSLNNLRATSASSVWVISVSEIRDFLDKHPDIRHVMAEELFRTAHERFINLYRQSPKERYVELLNRCPDILQNITLKELASYLQITPTHLSRIRKEILCGDKA